MTYKNIVKARFISRPNRFIAVVDINGSEETVHVKNTGRCKELLITDATVYLSKSDNPLRKTAYDLIAVEKTTSHGDTMLINMDSQAPNAAAKEWLESCKLFPENTTVRSEVKYGSSRFDFSVVNKDFKGFVEVKGVTLEKDFVAMFPDAPTERGLKHIRELIECVRNGYRAYILFVIQMKGCRSFTPNYHTDPEFAQALTDAVNAGVEILAYDCLITPDSMILDSPVEIIL